MAAATFFVLTAIAAYMSNREESNSVRYVGQSSQLLMLTQRLAKDAQQALSGNSVAFDALEESRASLSNILTRLDKGEGALPATTGASRAALDEFMKSANKTLQDVQTLQEGRAGLVTLGVTVSTIDSVSAELRGLTQTMTDTFGGAQKEQAIRFALATERIGKDAGRLLGAGRNGRAGGSARDRHRCGGRQFGRACLRRMTKVARVQELFDYHPQ